MGELLSEVGDIFFSLIISYLSAIEFLYVVRHLYHYSFNHDALQDGNDGENLSQLQDSMRQQLANATREEEIAGTKVMKDGVSYKDGFRLDDQQAIIDQLKERLKNKELTDLRRKELDKELAKQMKIADQLRKELAEAEAKYTSQLKQKEEEETRKVKEEEKKRKKDKQKHEEENEKAEIEEKLREKQKRAEERAAKEAEGNVRKQAEAEQRRREEMQQQQQIEEDARKLADAEKLRKEEQQKREDEKERQLRKTQQAEQDKQDEEEANENARRLAEAERLREDEQQKRDKEEKQKHNLAEQHKREEEEIARLEEEENERKLMEAEIRMEEEHRLREEEERERLRKQQHEAAESRENESRIFGAERLREEEQQQIENNEDNTIDILEIERRLEEQIRAAEKDAELTEKERQLIESIKKRKLPEDEGNEQKEAELLRRILKARDQLEESEEEQSRSLSGEKENKQAKQKRIKENALLFLEAEKEMAEIQAKMLETIKKEEFVSYLDSAPETPIVEELCIKRSFSPLTGDGSPHAVPQTVKTQIAQDSDDLYSVRTKPLLFPDISDDASSIDPASSQQSSFGTQYSEEINTGPDSQYPRLERQDPDGEDTAQSPQYSDDYLRSLDGIKHRPPARENSSGRRRAFKKHRSNNSSNSSQETRQSRDEELKMFTSLEEEEMKNIRGSEFTPMHYTSEPASKEMSHHRRHKKSPTENSKHGDNNRRSSLDRLREEESDNPWGEVKPGHYKNTDFWKKEKTVSIDEEMEVEKPPSSENITYETADNMPNASSFEDATQIQNEEAITMLRNHGDNMETKKQGTDLKATDKEESVRRDNTNTCS